MKNKWFLKGFMFSLAFMAIIVLTYSASSGFWPYTEDYSFSLDTLFTDYNFDTSLYLSPLLQLSDYTQTFTNPYANVASTGSYYSDTFSTAGEQSFMYSNIFGYELDIGSYMYADPFYTRGGEHIYAGTLGASFAAQHDYTQHLFGGTDYYGSAVDLPWAHWSADYSTAYGTDAGLFGQVTAGSSMAYGKITPYSFANPDVAAIYNLIAYAPVTTQMDMAMGDTLMVTAEGMPFYPVASYYNPYGGPFGSNWLFQQGMDAYASGTP